MGKEKLKFYYKNEFNYKTKVCETFDDICTEGSTFDYVVDRFKSFLISCQFSEELVNKIQIVEDENDRI
jgi:hypothetical protein